MKHNSLYEFEVLVDGNPVFEYEKDNNIFIEGRKNSNYSIRVRNNSSKKILAVISVDGLSVMDGKEADRDSRGYVIDPYNSVVIPGWTLDNNNVAAFRFGDKQSSYKAKSEYKTSEGTGVIGCLIYPEKERQVEYVEEYTYIPLPYFTPDYSYWKYWNDITAGSISPNGSLGVRDAAYYSSNDTVTGMVGMNSAQGIGASDIKSSINNLSRGISAMTAHSTSQNASFELGTEFGEKQDFQTRTVEFERDQYGALVMQMYYDSRRGLINRGIKVAPIAKKEQLPQAFKNGGCKPPAD